MRAALIAAIAMISAVAHATPSQELDEARKAFRNGQLSLARVKYNDLLYPQPRLANTDEIVEAYVYLGVCRVDDSDIVGAKREFEKALALDANRQLDPLLVTNKDAIRIFDDTKADLRNRERDAAAKQALAKAAAEREALLKSTVFYESHQFSLNFLPPLGQFQNDERLKGALFGAGELATFGTSFGIWYYLVNRYGLDNQHLNVSRSEAQTIRTMQEVELVSGGAFIVLYAYASYDAYKHYKPQVRKAVDEKLLKEQLDQELSRPPPKPVKTTFHIVPIITPSGGAGIGVGWEN